MLTLLIEAALSLLVSLVGNIVASGPNETIKSKVNNLLDGGKHEKELYETLCKLEEDLASIHVNHISQLSLPSDWLDNVESILYEMEDIQDSKEPKPKDLASFLKSMLKYSKMVRDLKKPQKLRKEDTQQASFPADETSIREEDKEKIIELIEKSPFGVSIVGIGGSGKTVLAQAVARDGRISSRFSRVPDPLQSHNFNLDKAINYVEGGEQNGSVFFQLDDLQSVTAEHWELFRSRLRSLHPGSKVLITTQNPRVVNITATSEYSLKPLSETQCFSLIKKRANPNNICIEDDGGPMIHNRKILVDMCKGLPLLANQIGRLLSSAAGEYGQRRTIQHLIKSMWEVPDLHRVLVNLMPVSLLEQKPHLKRCLAYCSLFPQEYCEFREDNLVQFWIAEGFIPLSASEDASYLERTARESFVELRSCSMFQPSAMPPGDNPSYKMHGLAYDMAEIVASRAFCRQHVGKSTSTPEISKFTRHFSLNGEKTENDEDIDIDKLLCGKELTCEGLRTFLMFNDAGQKFVKNPTFYRKFKRLRVLDLSHTDLTNLHVSNLKHLRYLDLSHTPVPDLPHLSKSPKLQVLKLHYCTKLRNLPQDLEKLTSLVSLEVNPRSLAKWPSGIGKLTNLQRLDLFVVGKEEGFKIAELGGLNHLGKSLRITNLQNVETEKDARRANLRGKEKLDRLEFEWSTPATKIETARAKQVFEGLQPPTNLTELVVRNYPGAKFPQWLSNIEVCGSLNFVHLDRCTAKPSLVHLKRLKTLRVDAMHDVSGINVSAGQPGEFPCIETLVLCNMEQINQWIELAAISMPHLCNVRVDKCRKLIRLPDLSSLKSLKELQIRRCAVLEELPTLPPSLKRLFIKDSNHILERRCQAEGADWDKLGGVKVMIDDVLLFTYGPLPPLISN